jgi:hypothetical protein
MLLSAKCGHRSGYLIVLSLPNLTEEIAIGVVAPFNQKMELSTLNKNSLSKKLLCFVSGVVVPGDVGVLSFCPNFSKRLVLKFKMINPILVFHSQANPNCTVQ